MAIVQVLAMFASLMVAGTADGSGWTLRPATATQGPVLDYKISDHNRYIFECTPQAVVVTQAGVTKLIGLPDGKPIGDDAAATMPEGAAQMALYAGKGEPAFLPATATKNVAGGWDLVVRVARNDPQLRRMTKSEIMSLFTTGYTTAVQMDQNARATWQLFLKECDALPS